MPKGNIMVFRQFTGKEGTIYEMEEKNRCAPVDGRNDDGSRFASICV